MVLGATNSIPIRKPNRSRFSNFIEQAKNPFVVISFSILNGVLELDKNVETIMTPLKDTMILSADAILDHNAVDAILLSGYSRFPVHEPGNPLAFIGLPIKKFLTYDPSQALPVSSFSLSILPTVNCFQALDYLYGFSV